MHIKDGIKYLHLNDFGIAREENDINHLDTSIDIIKGTFTFLAPECFKEDKSKNL